MRIIYKIKKYLFGRCFVDGHKWRIDKETYGNKKIKRDPWWKTENTYKCKRCGKRDTF